MKQTPKRSKPAARRAKLRPRGRPFVKGNTLRKDGVSGRRKGARNKVEPQVQS